MPLTRRALGLVVIGVAALVSCATEKPKAPDAGPGDPCANGNPFGNNCAPQEPDAASSDAGPVIESAFPRTLASSSQHACWLDAASTITCQGDGGFGWDRPPPAPFARLDIHDGTGCAIDASQHLTCWGENRVDPPTGPFVDVAVGDKYACGIGDRGVVQCWADASDHPGNPFGGTYKHIDSSETTVCAVSTTGSILCWGGRPIGGNDFPAGHYEEVAVGDSFVCARKEDGGVACESIEAPAGRFKRIAAGSTHACGVLDDGTLHCWGDGVALRVPPPTGAFVEIAAGREHTCAKRADDTVECWGEGWGNGSADYTCDFGVAELSGTLNGKKYSEQLTLGFPQVSASDGYLFRHYMGDGRGVMLLAGDEALEMEQRGPRFALTDGQKVDVDQGVLLLHADETSSGPVYCTGPGSTIERQGDEALLDLQAIGELGTCPGTAVKGEIEACYGGDACSGSITGTLDGETLPAGEFLSIGNSPFHASVGGYFIRWMTEPLGATDKGKLAWGYVFTDPQGPLGGAVYCIGQDSEWTYTDNSGTGFDDYSFVFRSLSKLGSCSGVSGSDALSGCMR